MKTTKNNTKATRFLGAAALAAFAGTGCNQSGSGSSGTASVTRPSAPSGPTFGTTRSLSLIEARTGAAVAALDSGASVLVAGGRTPIADATDTAELVNASEAISTPLAGRLATPRAGARAVALPGGRVLVLGGHDAHGKALATTEIFDGLAGAFGPGPNLAAPRDGATIAFVASSSVAVLGGAGETSVEILDLAHMHSTKLAGSLAHSHQGAHARAFGSTIVLAGGEDAPEAFDVATATASTPERDGAARQGEALLSIPNAVLLVGGSPAKGSVDSLAHELSSPWKSIMAFRTVGSPRSLGQAVAFGGGELLLGGRDAAGALLRSTDFVDTSSFGTKAGPELSSGRLTADAVALQNGQVLVVGGQDASGEPLANVDLLMPPGSVAPDAERAFEAAKSDAEAHAKLLTQLSGEKSQLTASAAALSSETAALDNADDKVQQLQIALFKSQDALSVKSQELARTQTQLTVTQSQLVLTQNQLTTAQGQLTQTKAQLATSQQSLAQANAANQTAQTQIASLNQTVAQQSATIAQQNQTIAQQNQTIAQLQSQLAAARSQPTPTQPAPTPTTTPAPVTKDITKSLPTPVATPSPRPTPAPAPAPAPALPGALGVFGDAWINSVSPNPARAGQQVQLGVSQGHAPVAGGVQVYFEGVPATVLGASFSVNNGTGTIDVTVPNVPAGLYKVQFTAGNYVSHAFTFTVK